MGLGDVSLRCLLALLISNNDGLAMAVYGPVIVVIVAIGDAYIAVEYNEKHDSVLSIMYLCYVLHKCRYVVMLPQREEEEKVFLLFYFTCDAI